MSSISIAVGRVLLGLYFLVPGLMKLAQPAETLAYMQSHDIAFAGPLMWFATAANILGGLFLIAARHVKIVAYLSVVYVLLVNAVLHDFWTMSGDSAARETQNFIKNLGIVAGLLVLAGHAPSRALSLTDWWRNDARAAQRG
ncbi:MAG: DoxX family protein [Pseudomonadota bacterium]